RSGSLGGKALQLRANEERLAQLLARDRAHAHTAVRLERHEPERGELAQRLADRGAADLELVGELLLAQHGSGRELARDDRLLDHEGDVVGLRAERRHGRRSYAARVRNST